MNRTQKTVACARRSSPMRIAMALLAVSLAFGSTACKKKEKAPDTTTMGSGSAMAGSDTGGMMAGSAADTGSAAMAGSGSAEGSGAGSGSAATEMPKRGGNCPSTVAGSTTKAELKNNTVVLTI